MQDVTVLGYLPRDLDFEIPHRHLGLTVAEETPLAKENIAKLAETVLEHIDLNFILQQTSTLQISPGALRHILSFPLVGNLS